MYVHIDVHIWSKRSMFTIRKELMTLFSRLREEGYEVLFCYTDDIMSVKFSNLVYPLDGTEVVGTENLQYFLSYWDLEDIVDVN